MANWFETEKVPFSWREWQKIHNSSKGVHGGKDKRKECPNLPKNLKMRPRK